MGNVRDRAELAKYYASADVFVHPNPREPFGIGPLEAMASRVPVVSPSAGGVLSYANPTNAWLAEPLRPLLPCPCAWWARHPLILRYRQPQATGSLRA